MSHTIAVPEHSVSSIQPHERIWELTNAAVACRCLHLVAELGVADQIADASVHVEELASRCGAAPDALDRVLRLLAAHGVFRRADGGYAQTPSSLLLRSDHPMSMRAFGRMMGLPIFWASLAQLEHSIRTGRPAIELEEPGGLWAYLQDRPDEAQIFGQAMAGKAGADIAAVLGTYDFSRFGTIADIGGGHGHLLRAVLDEVPSAAGILFDLPGVIGALDVRHERLTPHAGDFLADPLPAADAYVLMEILHDWPDEQCIAILSAIRRAAAPGATVLVIESILDEDYADPRAQTLDIIMLYATGGRERTSQELAALFNAAGFSDGTVIHTGGPLRIAETTAV